MKFEFKRIASRHRISLVKIKCEFVYFFHISCWKKNYRRLSDVTRNEWKRDARSAFTWRTHATTQRMTRQAYKIKTKWRKYVQMLLLRAWFPIETYIQNTNMQMQIIYNKHSNFLTLFLTYSERNGEKCKRGRATWTRENEEISKLINTNDINPWNLRLGNSFFFISWRKKQNKKCLMCAMIVHKLWE